MLFGTKAMFWLQIITERGRPMTNNTFWGPKALSWERHLSFYPVGKAWVSCHQIPPSLLPLLNQYVVKAVDNEEQTSLGYVLKYKVIVLKELPMLGEERTH